MPAVYLWQNVQSRLVSFMILTDCPDKPMPALTAREVCQVLRDAIFGRRGMVRVCAQTSDELYTGSHGAAGASLPLLRHLRSEGPPWVENAEHQCALRGRPQFSKRSRPRLSTAVTKPRSSPIRTTQSWPRNSPLPPGYASLIGRLCRRIWTITTRS